MASIPVWSIDGTEYDAEIVGARYYAGHPGSFYRSNGDPGDPPEPAEAEWDRLEVTLEDGTALNVEGSDLFNKFAGYADEDALYDAVFEALEQENEDSYEEPDYEDEEPFNYVEEDYEPDFDF